MDAAGMSSFLEIGETVAVEFKRCGNGIENDVYETVCSFLNRFGGDLFLGVLDDGTVLGVPEKAAPDMVKNFISCISNPTLFTPTVYLSPEILKYEGKTVIHVHIMPSAEVHSYKKVIYDRVDDADVKVTATAQIAQMYIRKQDIFTERKVYPYVGIEDLRLDLLPKLRIMAANNASGQGHPWGSMSDEEVLKSSRLYSTDRVTGVQGYNLAAVMLLGKDDVIMDVVPAYVTDALVRRVDKDRYDDREVVKTNLIESYERLMEFGRKHLPDIFFLEEDQRKSLRNIITREMIANTLIHREYTSTYQAKFVIERERMYIENANRASQNAVITPENLDPNPKNPIVASFFRNIGYADQLGSGVRNLFKYSVHYSGKVPQFVEGDVFRIIVPLEKRYCETTPRPAVVSEQVIPYSTHEEAAPSDCPTQSAAVPSDCPTQSAAAPPNRPTQSAAAPPNHPTQSAAVLPNCPTQSATAPPDCPAQSAAVASRRPTQSAIALPERPAQAKPASGHLMFREAQPVEGEILRLFTQEPGISQSQLAKILNVNLNTVKYHVRRLQEKGCLERVGTSRKGYWIVKETV